MREPVIASWLDFYRQMGLDTGTVRPAQLALCLRILKGKDIAKINNVVDAANIVAATSKCPVGAFDIGKMSLPVTLRLSHEGESFVPLFCSAAEMIPFGEVVYADEQGIFSRYSKDADRTKITESTTEVLFVVDGAPSVQQGLLSAALERLEVMLGDVAGRSARIERGYVEAS